jgi:hypothetical protein
MVARPLDLPREASVGFATVVNFVCLAAATAEDGS